MKRKSSLFFKILNSLHNAGVLEDIILIGSWCHYFYKDYFSNAPEIPLLRTLDVDFLIPNPPRIQKDVNIPELLENLNFMSLHNYLTGYTKYVHPELELEFLLQSHTIKIKYPDITVVVPEPAAYVLHKFIIYERRSSKEKQLRDLLSAKEIGEFLLRNKTQQRKIVEIFISLPAKWQKVILRNLKDNSKLLYDFLFEID